MAADELTPKQQRFVEEYLADPDMNATAAYRRSFPECKSNEAAGVNASKLLGSAKIQEEIQRQQADRAKRTKITQDKVLQQFWAIATADPNELIEYRRVCCRHCHGHGFGFQRTDRELARDRAHHDAQVLAFKPGKGKLPPGPFNEEGGPGYDERREPNPDCPECFGDGVGKVLAKDTRNLSPEARRLYAGVKQTKDGLEIKTHDQMAALANVGKMQGYFTENVKLSGSVAGWDLSKLTENELRTLGAIAARASGSELDPEGDDPPGSDEATSAVPLADGPEPDEPIRHG